MRLFATAESRRKFGETLWEFDPREAFRWIATAECMDAGAHDAYQDARDAWRASEPQPIDFIPAGRARLLVERYEEANAKARERVERIWGPFLSRPNEQESQG